MTWQFRFPIALLSYIKEGTQGYQLAIEHARDWAKPLGKTRYKRPTLTEAEAYISQIIEEDKKVTEEKKGYSRD